MGVSHIFLGGWGIFGGVSPFFNEEFFWGVSQFLGSPLQGQTLQGQIRPRGRRAQGGAGEFWDPLPLNFGIPP